VFWLFRQIEERHGKAEAERTFRSITDPSDRKRMALEDLQLRELCVMLKLQHRWGKERIAQYFAEENAALFKAFFPRKSRTQEAILNAIKRAYRRRRGKS
jgi:hypothetical protein